MYKNHNFQNKTKIPTSSKKMCESHFYMNFTVIPCLRWFTASLSQQRPEFNPKAAHVGFVMDKVAMRQV
jgi:hypothetical protein